MQGNITTHRKHLLPSMNQRKKAPHPNLDFLPEKRMLFDRSYMFTANFFDFLDSPAWRAWPFNAGYGEQFGPVVARMLFIMLIFGVIIAFLRILFGPKGYFRDEEMDREAEEMRQQEREELEEQFKNGEINEFEYQIKLKRING